MKISFLCSDAKHPICGYLNKWIEGKRDYHDIELVHAKSDISGGDILFLVSCTEIVTAADRGQYHNCLILHASDLPIGRGWSPHIWEISRGADRITLSLLEAEDKVDSGRIWKKKQIPIPKHALWDEINNRLFEAEIDLIDFAVNQYDAVEPKIQAEDIEATYYPRRNPEDSRIDPSRSLIEQFNLIRVCDPNRFPAFFEYLGHRYTLKIEKYDDE